MMVADRESISADPDLAILHGMASRMAASVPLPKVLAEVVEFATSVVRCDSCFIYVLEGDELVLRASKNPHPEAVDRLKVKLGEGITGWVAQHMQAVSVPKRAFGDSRFQFFNQLPEDRFEAFLSVPILSRGRLGRCDQFAEPPPPCLQPSRVFVDDHHRIPGRRRDRNGAA